jgi:hypothetical protein
MAASHHYGAVTYQPCGGGNPVFHPAVHMHCIERALTHKTPKKTNVPEIARRVKIVTCLDKTHFLDTLAPRPLGYGVAALNIPAEQENSMALLLKAKTKVYRRPGVRAPAPAGDYLQNR